MPDPDRARRVALAAGAIVAGGGLASVGLGLAVDAGAVTLPEAVGLTGPSVLMLTGTLTVLVGALAAWRGRRAARELAAGHEADPYWIFDARRLAASAGLGFVAVAVVAVLAKTVIEAASTVTYTIHWIETVPLLTLAFAWIIHGEWARRRPPEVPEPEEG